MESWGENGKQTNQKHALRLICFSDDEDFTPKVIVPSTLTANKWEGEDEEEEVKVSFSTYVMISVLIGGV